jgi:effector-binding domain-containing protein
MIPFPANESREESAMRINQKDWLRVALGAVLLSVGAAPARTAQSIEVSLQKVEPFAYFCMRVKGPYTQVQEAVGKLMQEVQAQNAMPTGPLMGIYYNNAAETESKDLEWEIGFPFSPSHIIQPPLVVKDWNFAQVAACLHRGPYAESGKTVTKIIEWMTANGYAPAGPILERYLDMNPTELDPRDLKTEIWIPCQKK